MAIKLRTSSASRTTVIEINRKANGLQSLHWFKKKKAAPMDVQVHVELPNGVLVNTKVTDVVQLSYCNPDTLLYLGNTALFHPQKWVLEEWSVG